jgi:hypothetical protein
MAIPDDEALALPVGAQVSMGKRIFTCVRRETIDGLKQPVLIDEKGDRLSCVLYVTHILHHHVPVKPVVSTTEPAESPELVVPVAPVSDEPQQPQVLEEVQEAFSLQAPSTLSFDAYVQDRLSDGAKNLVQLTGQVAALYTAIQIDFESLRKNNIVVFLRKEGEIMIGLREDYDAGKYPGMTLILGRLLRS